MDFCNLSRLFGLMFVCVLFVGCQQQNVKNQLLTKKEVDLKQAFSLAVDKIDSVTTLSNKEFKLTVRRSKDEWRFTFFFLPETPGEFLRVTVSTTGDVELTRGL